MTDDAFTIEKLRAVMESFPRVPTDDSVDFTSLTRAMVTPPPAHSFARTQVMTTNSLPREEVGCWVEALHGPAWFAWILRRLGISPVTWMRWPMYADSKVYRIGNMWLMSPNMLRALRQQTGVATDYFA